MGRADTGPCVLSDLPFAGPHFVTFYVTVVWHDAVASRIKSRNGVVVTPQPLSAVVRAVLVPVPPSRPAQGRGGPLPRDPSAGSNLPNSTGADLTALRAACG
jgi:hypothetical protein